MFVITGGGTGIGRALAQDLANRGVRVLVIGRREQPLQDTASFSPLIKSLAADVSTEAGRQQIVSYLATEASITGLIHNAAIIDPIVPIASIDEPAWDQQLKINLNAPLFLSQSLLPKLKNAKVLNIGSGAAYFPVAGWAAYCVSKAALAMLTRCWQLEYKETAFASVMPGIIDTDMQAVIRNSQFMDPEKIDFFKTLHREGRLVSTKVVASFLTWLLLDLDNETFASQEWDIYDKSHHSAWLVAPLSVPDWE